MRKKLPSCRLRGEICRQQSALMIGASSRTHVDAALGLVSSVAPAAAHGCSIKVADERMTGIRVLGDPKSADAPHASVSAVSSNSRCEDRLAVHSFGTGDACQHYYAVFDGHGGWECAEFAHNLLSASISACLQEGKGRSAEEEMEEAIACGFLKVRL